MADKPIIFSGPMVRALLDGSKTQTRRELKGKSGILAARGVLQRGAHWLGIEYDRSWPLRLPYAIGDRLWVREAFWTCDQCGHRNMCEGGANHSGHIGRWCCASCDELLPQAKTSPIFMPRWASRLTLTVTDVRVQRLQEISRGDAMAEGCPFANMAGGPDPRAWFQELWGQIHPSIIRRTPGSSKGNPAAWSANPWVAAYTFTVQRANIDQLAAA